MWQRFWMYWMLAMVAGVVTVAKAAALPMVCFEESPLAQQLVAENVGPYQVRGLFGAKIAKAFLASDYPIQFKALPWRRCLEAVSRDQAAAAFPVGWSAERAKSMLFPQTAGGEIDTSLAIGEVDYYVYVRHDSKVQWNGLRFSGVEHGISSPKGYLVEQQLKNLQVWREVESDIRTGLALVSKGRLDGIVLDPRIAAPFLTKYQDENRLMALPIPVQKNPIYLVFSRKFCQQPRHLCQQIWDNLRQQRPTASANPPVQSH